MKLRHLVPVLAAIMMLAAVSAVAQDSGTVFKIGASPPAQGVYTKVNLTEPYNIIEGFTIYASLHSPDLFYYYPKPRVARTKEGRLVFRLLSYAMAENKNQVGSADVAGGYLQFDVTMSPTPEEEKKIKQELLNPPKRFGTRTFGKGGLHPYLQVFGKSAKPKNVRLAPIPIDDLKAKARIPGVLAGDKTETEWFKASGDASGQTTFAINLSGPQSLALYQAIMEPAAVEPFNVFFEGYIGGYIKCNAYMTVNTSEVFKFMQTQEGSCTKTEVPGKKSCSIFGITLSKGSAAKSSTEEYQSNNIDASTMIGTAIKIGGDLQGYDDALMAMAKYALDSAIARFGTPITLDELMDEKHELQTPTLPAGTGGSSNSKLWAYFSTAVSTAMFGPVGGLVSAGISKRDVGRQGYYGYFDQKTLNRANSMSFSVDLNKQIAVEWQFSPSTSIFDDRLVQEIRSNGKMYAQKLALNDPFFEKLDITYGAQLDFAGGPFNKVVFTDIFKLKDGTNYSVPGLLLESKDYLDPKTGQLIGAAPPSNLRFGGLLQGNLWQGSMGSSFNILDPVQRRQAYTTGKWPTYTDGSQVSGITHRWQYTVYFRPSTRDTDFPSSWKSDPIINSDTVCLADIPPKVTVITLSSDALDQNRVKAALVKVKYRSRLDHKGKPNAEIIKSAKLRPGGPDKDLFFYDDDPKVNKPCEYMYRLLYYGQPTYTSKWIKEEGGWIVLEDPNDVGGAPLMTPPAVFQAETSTGAVVDDVFF